MAESEFQGTKERAEAIDWRVCSEPRDGERINVICYTVTNNASRETENSPNAVFIADAFNVRHDTGLTPRELQEQNNHLRRLLATVYSGVKLYGDDGELSDASTRPHIDFVRMTPEQIEVAFIERARAALLRSETE